MDQKITKSTTEKQLLQARERGLQESLEVSSMRAHGKVFGMDTFSWMNPQIDTLATVLESFPFDVLWVGSHDQVKDILENYPTLAQKIETIILHDNTLLNVNRAILHTIKNIACVEGTSKALEMVKSLKPKKGALLYTTDNVDLKSDRADFEQFISVFK